MILPNLIIYNKLILFNKSIIGLDKIRSEISLYKIVQSRLGQNIVYFLVYLDLAIW